MSQKLTELAIRNAKPKFAKYTLSAGHGLTLIVMPDGSKYWRQRYTVAGQRNMVSIGPPSPAECGVFSV